MLRGALLRCGVQLVESNIRSLLPLTVGFKFASVIGSILADMALSPGGATPFDADLKLHRLDRQRPGHAAVLDAFSRG